LTPRPSEGSLVPASCGDSEAAVLVPSRYPRHPREHRYRRTSQSVLRSSSQSCAVGRGRGTPRPRFDDRSKQGRVVVGGCVVVAGARSSSCARGGCGDGLARRVAVVVFGCCAGSSLRSWGVVSFVCCWPGPTTLSRNTKEQDQCHHGRSDRPTERAPRSQSIGGSFLASSPGSILTSVEGPGCAIRDGWRCEPWSHGRHAGKAS
jgi:hypothetical protein